MANTTVNVIIDAYNNASKDINRVRQSLDGLGKKGLKLTGILAGVSASIPTFAPVIAGVGALASMFTVAGAGAVGFGAVAVSVIGDVVNASSQIAEAEKAIANADSTEERIQAKQRLQQIMNGLTKAEKESVKQLQSFKSWWSGFTAELQAPVLDVFNQGLQLVQNIMEGLKPTIKTTANVLAGFLENMNKSFNTDQVQSFFTFFEKNIGGNLSALLTTASNLFVGFMETLRQFTPLTNSFSKSMVGMSESFRQWAQSLSNNKGFETFVNYVKTNGPIVGNVISNIFKFVGQLVQALAPMGTVVMSVAQSFTQWLTTSTLVQNALNLIRQAGEFLLNHLGMLKAVLATTLTAFLAFKGIVTIVAIIKTAMTVFRTLKSVITTVRIAVMMLNTTFLANPITWVIAGIVALIAIGVTLWKNWDKIKAKLQQLWNRMKLAWQMIKQVVATTVTKLIAKVIQMKNNMLQAIVQFASRAWSKFKSWASNMVASAVNWVINTAQQANQLKNRVVQAVTQLASNALSALTSGISNMLSAIGNWVSDTVSKAGDLASKFVSKVGDMMGDALSALSDGLSEMISTITGWVGDFTSSGKSLLTGFVDGVKDGFSNAVSAVKDGMDKVRDFLPFSPAKKGPLRDLDKSGESFFPTWIGGALKKLPQAQRDISGAMGAMNRKMQEETGDLGIEYFSGGRTRLVVTHRHEHSGKLKVDGDTSERTVDLATERVQETTQTDVLKDFKQQARRR